jgi:hypothetical protein
MGTLNVAMATIAPAPSTFRIFKNFIENLPGRRYDNTSLNVR